MPPSSGELWGHHLMPQTAIVDCLLPTGIVIPLPCARDATLEDIKAHLWKEAKKYPLYNLLAEPASYIFVSITQEAEREEFFDESRRLCDLRLFQLILKVVEPEGNKAEKILNYEIGKAIGVPLHEVDHIEDMEVIQYRRNLFSVCKEVVESRDPNDIYQQALFAYPPEVEATATLPSSLLKKLDSGTLIMCVWQDSQEPKRTTIKIPYDALPCFAIAEVLNSISKKMGYTKDQRMLLVDSRVDYYVLKVCGVQEYFLKPFPLCQYRYIRQCLRKGEIPELVLHPRDELYRSLPSMEFHLPMYMRKLPQQTRSPWNSLWNLQGKLKVHILLATYVSVWDVDTIYVRAGVFHGPESLCQIVDSPQVTYSNPKWDKWLTFDLDLVNLPRNARLCLSICSVAKRRRKEEHCMVAWGNLNLFNYEGYLLSGKISLYLWPVPKGMDELLNRLGTSGSNPVKESQSPCLEIEMESYAMPVLYPDYEQIEGYARFLKTNEQKLTLEEEMSAKDVVKEIIQKERGFADIQYQEDFQWRYRKDPLSDMSEQEKDLLWRFRKQCVLLPHSLPRLLDAVKWEERDQTSQILVLLKSWPSVPPEVALELLDCKYADPSVRKYAVRWLDTSLTDDKLSQYLLQLVQTLKYEPYLDNDLARFLLKRALTNKKIGHFLFWYMKSEMHVPGLSIRFGLMLEAYCRGAGAHLKQLVRQVDALDKLTKLSDSLKVRKLEPLKERLKFFHEQVMQQDYLEALHNWTSPLKNSNILGKLEVKECKILDSAKRPLWLVWNNPDPKAECLLPHHAIIFKNGDDLRQDMLTLQMLRIMDHIWQSEDLDLRLTPYACLSTGKEVGMIEVVRKSKTVYSIQKASKWGAFQMDDTQLHKWIKEKSKGMESKYEQAIENFTLSCAGYCVATFILGIGDRHPDNIMVNEDGQIFHIDFGHFLGHFKKKFGINRERVPFVLTDDFLHVISKGVENPRKSKEFKKFQGLCVEAYLALRHHASLLITLFMMMLPTGIPELQSIDDVGYLRKTLAVEKTEPEAIEYFKNQLCDAYSSAWKTKVDWFFHGVNH